MGGNSPAGTGSRRIETDENHWIWRMLISLMWALILVAAVEVALWVWASERSQTAMRDDLFGALLNLGLVAIIGGGIAALYKWIEREVEAARLRAGVRTQYLSRMGAAYRSVKKARRMLRADGVIANAYSQDPELSENETGRYDHHMARINDAQLELEALRIEAETLPDVATISGLDSQLKAMERYLDHLITEYERIRPGKSINRGDLEELNRFANPFDKSHFKAGFVAPHKTAIGLIGQRL